MNEQSFISYHKGRFLSIPFWILFEKNDFAMHAIIIDTESLSLYNRYRFLREVLFCEDCRGNLRIRSLS